MKKFSHQILAASMALVVLFATLSFTVSMHFCGDTLVETAVFHKAKGCGMETLQPSVEGCTITNKSCCNDTFIVVESQNEIQFSVDSISFEQQILIASFLYNYNTIFGGLAEYISSYRTYIPPLSIRELYKIDETYLI
jgi:hypothetical protein